ncbi:unnamed protein product [Spirodela intermedia]|uniref:ubiquitinyl hydrolase 1 n=1 Tax=Spirodela intermedia TaxID=51605 RepID=A0A7I8ICG9_SPIIN|nr:unnamed protein product [Spirodela intermedia]CAA6655518.1 unnamed protein product [Spirodela intermedia]
MCEHDPEIIRWGLQHLCDPGSSSCCENDSCFYARQYASEGNLGTDYTNVESDEIIAHTLQEEFSQLAFAKASGLSHPSEEHAHIYHKPRINKEIPSADEAISDHQRLLERLQLFELVERKVEGDGNCQFRALSDQFYRTAEHHTFVRQQVIYQVDLWGYVPMTYDEYLKKMSGTGEWGDHVTLQAAADSYGVRIFVFTSFKDTCYIEILPSVQKSERVILLSFWAEVHYNSIYPHGELPPSESKRKKSWWPFGHGH